MAMKYTDSTFPPLRDKGRGGTRHRRAEQGVRPPAPTVKHGRETGGFGIVGVLQELFEGPGADWVLLTRVRVAVVGSDERTRWGTMGAGDRCGQHCAEPAGAQHVPADRGGLVEWSSATGGGVVL